jgi:multiple sugar transport system permease protein
VKHGRSVQKEGAFWVLLMPLALYLVTWRLLPLLYMGWLSLTSWNIGRGAPPAFIGIGNYVRLLSDGRFLGAVKVSASFMLIATSLEVVLGVGLALLVNRGFRGQSLVRGILLVPMITSPVAVGTIWYLLYNSKIGPLTTFVEWLGFGTQDWLGATSTALLAIVAADLWEWTPFVFLLVLSGLQGIPDAVLEAARIDGASAWRVFRFITLPLLRGVIVAAGILRAMDAVKIFDTIFIMTGGGPGRSTESASLLVYRTAFTQFEFGYAASMVMVILMLTTSLYWLYTQIPQEV